MMMSLVALLCMCIFALVMVLVVFDIAGVVSVDNCDVCYGSSDGGGVECGIVERQQQQS